MPNHRLIIIALNLIPSALDFVGTVSKVGTLNGILSYHQTLLLIFFYFSHYVRFFNQFVGT